MGANEFKHVGLLPIEYRVEQLMLGHMFNIINGNAPGGPNSLASTGSWPRRRKTVIPKPG